MERAAARIVWRLSRVGRPLAVVAAVATLATAAPGPAGAETAGAETAPTAAGTVTGVVDDVVVEGSGAATWRVLRAGNDVIPLPPGTVPGAAPGDRVRAVVAGAGDARRVRSGRVVGGAGAQAAATVARGVHRVYVVVVRPRGVRADRGLTPRAAVVAVNRAAAYWRSQTGGAVRFRVAKVARPYASRLSCRAGVSRLWSEALDRAHVPAGETNHLVLFAPSGARAGCGYGLGTLGGGGTGLTFVTDPVQSLIAHELGHNLGLHHAGALHCRSVADAHLRRGRWPASCRREEYGDLLDVMGYSGRTFGEGNLNAVNLGQMGLLPSAVRRIDRPGRYRVSIFPLSATPRLRRAVEIVESSGQTYYVEYRTAAGRDAVAGRNRLHPALGVRVLRQHPAYDASSALVLDPSPSRSGDYANNLRVGGRFRSASGLTTIQVVGAGRRGATLLITYRGR